MVLTKSKGKSWDLDCMSSTMYNEIIKTLCNEDLSHFQCKISGAQREKTNPPRDQQFWKEFSALPWSSASSSASPPPSFASFFFCSFSSWAACQQLIFNSLLKTEPRGWPRPEAAVSTSSSTASSGWDCSRKNPGGVRALGRVSGATGNREELWRTGRCLQNEKWCPLRGCRATPQQPLGQQVNVRHQGPWGAFAFLSFLGLFRGRLIARADCRQEEFRGGQWKLLSSSLAQAGCQIWSYSTPKLHRQFFFFLVHPKCPVPFWSSSLVLPHSSACPGKGQDWGSQPVSKWAGILGSFENKPPRQIKRTPRNSIMRCKSRQIWAEFSSSWDTHGFVKLQLLEPCDYLRITAGIKK